MRASSTSTAALRRAVAVFAARESQLPSLRRVGCVNPRFYSTNGLQRPLAFAFDIDGVLKAGPNVLPEAKRALKILQGDNSRREKIPYIFITNGGGKHESARANDLAKELEVPVSPASLS